MAATTFSQVIFNSREQVLSSDLNRIQALASRDSQNVLKDASRRDDYVSDDGSVTTGNQSYAVDRLDVGAIPTGDNASQVVQVYGGRAFVDTSLYLTSDQSSYAVVIWDAAMFTIVPDGAQTRVDLIIATPAMVATDQQSRNIILDPVTRTVAPANVYKTNNPKAALSVVQGVAGTTDAPACPDGSVALWEVITKQTDTFASSYRFVPRLWRRLESLGTTHACLENCTPQTGLHSEATSQTPLISLVSQGGSANKVVRAVIDGEVICHVYQGNGSNGSLVAQPDTLNNPVTATIDANKDVFCYLYLCGGRHAPQNGVVGVSNCYGPLQLVASLVAPTAHTGRAIADLAINGVSVSKAGTLYCGVWAIAKGTHNYKSCVIDGDWIYASTKSSPLLVAGFTQPGGTGATGSATLTPPSNSTMVDLQINASDTSQAVSLEISATGTPAVDYYVHAMRVSETYQTLLGRCRCAIGSSSVFSWTGGTSATAVVIAASGYNMNVPRIG